MKIVLFPHPSGRLAIQPLVPHPPTSEALGRLLKPIPCRQWHPDEQLWTLPFEGPWASYFLTVLVRNGFQPRLDQLPRASPLRRLGQAIRLRTLGVAP